MPIYTPHSAIAKQDFTSKKECFDIDFEALAKYSKPGPRYTSYPTANEFSNNFTHINLRECLKDSDVHYKDKPLSLYTHLPFCKSACYFCGCNVIYTSKEERKERYINYLEKELSILSNSFDTNRDVVQFHFGGGTPTFFNASQLHRVFTMIRHVFPNFSNDCEISCEIDPRYFQDEQMAVLRENGCNRVSFGVQDFDSKVQQAVNRIQPIELVANSVLMARKYGISSINFDLIYGLPYQNVDSFIATLQTVISLQPDRLAIFNYAHVPWVKKTMRKINEDTLPNPSHKLLMLREIISFLKSNGYQMIGMDHFAKTNDSLYDSLQKGKLRRNFQGYTTKGFSQTIGIGVTSIGEGVNYYTQNHKDIQKYEIALDSNELPVACGIILQPEDILRKEVIMSLMNTSRLDFRYFNRTFDIDFISHFDKELQQISNFAELGFLELDSSGVRVNPTGNMLIRNIAMIFDTYLVSNVTKRFSKTI
ncbi:oxygen-independent coproporphyrinogen III oxidase [Helicobacter muridarum]|uniref:Coproporphyrinogen-III oxidase n=1 Tax=Helicobacter muridarum TaxID=216 RepID=A0A377PU36_9HELI|nr:oxygen-independent coproporphyrinogen III oxidase [Helicobacter muridarum]TLE01157.1 oxygen-independent coproporphyrinogen III oxidase [Helicobacter muridarum]STQ86030.1 coproporphyrinogen III oxidase [Helicobacter muridarum]